MIKWQVAGVWVSQSQRHYCPLFARLCDVFWTVQIGPMPNFRPNCSVAYESMSSTQQFGLKKKNNNNNWLYSESFLVLAALDEGDSSFYSRDGFVAFTQPSKKTKPHQR